MIGSPLAPVAVETSRLPRLLYIGDVPVESSYHGSALLYRLLQEYPADRLLVVERGLHQSLPQRRLHEVQYRQFSMGADRWLTTRFSQSASSWLLLNAPGAAMRLHRLCDAFKADAVLTVAHGHSWLAAARFAEIAELPLHLIVHDDWPTITPVFPWLKAWQDRRFGRLYRLAVSR